MLVYVAKNVSRLFCFPKNIFWRIESLEIFKIFKFFQRPFYEIIFGISVQCRLEWYNQKNFQNYDGDFFRSISIFFSTFPFFVSDSPRLGTLKQFPNNTYISNTPKTLRGMKVQNSVRFGDGPGAPCGREFGSNILDSRGKTVKFKFKR